MIISKSSLSATFVILNLANLFSDYKTFKNYSTPQLPSNMKVEAWQIMEIPSLKFTKRKQIETIMKQLPSTITYLIKQFEPN